MLIYIIRHGETDLNTEGIIQGATDEPLNETGRELAAVTGRNMRGIRFDACISSPLIRAVETAEIVLRESGNQDIPMTFDERIKEINAGVYERKKMTEGPLPLKTAELFYKDPFRFPGFPEGETVLETCRRTQEFLRELAARDDGKTYLVSLHGFALRAMLNPLYEDPSDFWHGHPPFNCVVNIVEAEHGNMRLIADDRLYYDASLAVNKYKI